jgi:hypothetical protein
MPMIELVCPAGALSESAKTYLMQAIASRPRIDVPA